MDSSARLNENGLMFSIFFLFAAAAAQAQPAAPKALVDGNFLHSACTNQDPRAQEFCTAYIGGLVDQLWNLEASAGRRFCPPATASLAQFRDIALKHLQAKPEVRHRPAAALATAALIQTFPCRK